MFKTITDATNWVASLKKENKLYRLDDMSDALVALNIKKDDLKIIHIGGTNGKGSTCAALTNVLVEAKYKVGRYISPFVVKFNERISINNEYISDDKLLDYINYFYEFNNKFMKNHNSLSFFEITTLIALKYFKEEKVDLVVFEVGLGGRLDATNCIIPIISCVTNIQKDHMKELGNTYFKILNEKLGIMKPNVPFITSIHKPKLIERVIERGKELNSEVILVNKPKNVCINESGTSFTYKRVEYHTNLIGYHQSDNISLVIEIINKLNDIGYDINDIAINVGINTIKWPGRFEEVNGFILDGGHNKEGIEAIKKTVDGLNYNKVCTIFCAMKDKEVEKMINIVESFSDLIIYTSINYYRSDNCEDFLKYTKNKNAYSVENVKMAINEAYKLKNKGYKVIFLGSLYFISEVRKMLLEDK